MLIEAGGYLRGVVSSNGLRVAVKTSTQSLTYNALDRAANLIGSGLSVLGIEQGSRVAVLSHNRAEVVELWLGLERANLVRVIMHTHFDMPTHVATLREVGAVALVFDVRFSDAIDAARAGMTSVRHFIAIGENPPAWAQPYEDVKRDGCGEVPAIDVDENAPVTIQLTTGTTGHPKPWIVSHRGWRTLIANNQEHLDTLAPDMPALGVDDVNLHFHALQWASGSQTMMPYMLRGAMNFVMDDVRFDPVQILDTIVGQAVTGAFVPAQMLAPILDMVEARGGLSHRLRRLVIFFATPELLERTTRVLGPVWCHGFGSTEQGSPVTRLTPHDVDEKPQRLSSVGRPASTIVEIAVVDQHGARLKPKDVGEIVVRSPMSSSRYWSMPEKTAETYFPGGWFRSNDIGYVDEDGFLFYLDRGGDRIQTTSGTVYPHVVETVLMRHSAVVNCSVVGLGAADAEEVAAAIVLSPDLPDALVAKREILKMARLALEAHEVPTQVSIVDSLPTVLGGAKVQRKKLREILATGAER